MDTQTDLYLALWRRSALAKAPIEVRMQSPAEARRVRFAMYNALRSFKSKDGKAPKLTPDVDLARAIRDVGIVIKATDPCVLVLGKKADSAASLAIRAALGEVPEGMAAGAATSTTTDPMTGPLAADPHQDASRSLQAVLDKLDNAGGSARKTPYYTR